MIKLSFLLPVFSGKDEQLELSLQSLTKHHYDKKLVELIVFLDYVDSKSTQAILKRYQKHFNRVVAFGLSSKKQKINHSASRRNFLALHAQGEYIIFAEPEMFHFDQTINNLLKYLSANKNKKEWVCGPVYAGRDMCDKQGKITDHYIAPPPLAKIAPVFKLPNLQQQPEFKKLFSLLDYKEYITPFFVCMLYRKTFLKLKGLNQKLKVRGFEEVEFAKRFTDYGGKIIVYDKIPTIHIPHQRNLDVEAQISWNLYNSTIDFDSKQVIGEINDANVQKIIL